MSPINIVFDIDGLLACPGAKGNNHPPFFWNRGLVISAIFEHYIYPGVVELMQRLFTMEGIKVSFFSAGDRARNAPLIRRLLRTALGRDKYRCVKGKYKLLSSADLEWRTLGDFYRHKKLCGIDGRAYQKNLLKVLEVGDRLENTILCEDDQGVFCSDQTENMLYAPSPLRESEFTKLARNSTDYNKFGFKMLPCVFCVDELSYHLQRASFGKQITIYKQGADYAIAFTGAKGNTPQWTLLEHDGSQHSQLIYLLDNACNDFPGQNFQLLKETELIYSFLISKKGKVQKICYRVNRIYYLAGMLFSAIEKASRANSPIAPIIHRRQYHVEEDCCFERFKVCLRSEKYYLRGLYELQKVNPKLAFMTPQLFLPCIDPPSKPEVDEAL